MVKRVGQPTHQSMNRPAERSHFIPGFIAILLVLLATGCSRVTETPLSPTPTVTAAATSASTTSAPTPIALPWWNDRIFYEVFIRSFYDSNGDGNGDLQGLIDKLDYLNDGDSATATDLGITGLWLMPVMEAASYHGYDVIDYQKIEQDYGTNADFKELIHEAHKRGIAVIIDMVLNHTSNQHPWFIDAQTPGSEHDDWYIWQSKDPGYLGPWNEPVWHPAGGRYYYGVFSAEMPDLNYQNPAVTSAMEAIGRFWLEDMEADGFRLDAARDIIEEGEKQINTPATHAWLRGYHSFVRAVQPDALLVGEVWDPTTIVATYTSDQVDLAFEFDLAADVLTALRRGDASLLAYDQGQALELIPPGQYAAFLSNHDQNRVMSELDGHVDAAKVASTLLLTNPGVPFIYYGEEIGMFGEKPDELIRTPMQWDATTGTAGFTTGKPWIDIPESHPETRVSQETADPGSLLSHYRTLIRLRQAHEALTTGDTILVHSDNKAVYALLRHIPGETLLILANVSDQQVSGYHLSLPAGPLGGEPGAAMLMGDGQPAALMANASGGFDSYTPLADLPPYSSFIIALIP